MALTKIPYTMTDPTLTAKILERANQDGETLSVSVV